MTPNKTLLDFFPSSKSKSNNNGSRNRTSKNKPVSASSSTKRTRKEKSVVLLGTKTKTKSNDPNDILAIDDDENNRWELSLSSLSKKKKKRRKNDGEKNQFKTNIKMENFVKASNIVSNNKTSGWTVRSDIGNFRRDTEVEEESDEILEEMEEESEDDEPIKSKKKELLSSISSSIIDEDKSKSVDKEKSTIIDKEKPTTIDKDKSTASEKHKSGYGVLLSALKDRSIMNTQMRNRKRMLSHNPSNPSSYHSRAIEHIIQRYSLSQFHTSSSVQLKDKGSSSILSNRLSSSSLCDLTSLVFDSVGVLLAVSTPRYGVRIYDFDELMAKDLKVRNSYNANADSEEQNVQKSDDSDDIRPKNIPKRIPKLLKPMLQIPMTRVVSCLGWNPDNEDQIAVAFQSHNDVYMYDLNIIAATKKKNRQQQQRTPSPCIRFINRSLSTHEMKGSKSLLFLCKSQHATSIKKNTTCLLVGSISGIIRMWSIPNNTNKQQQQPSCLWVCKIFSASNTVAKNPEPVSVMKLLTSTTKQKSTNNNNTCLLLVGGSRGNFVLVDIAKQSRMLFTNSISPTILRRWNMSIIINKQYPSILLSENMCAIKKICIWQQETNQNKIQSSLGMTTSDETILNLLRESFISIVISNGWVLNLKFNDTCRLLTNLDVSLDAMFVTPTTTMHRLQEDDPQSQIIVPDIPSHATQMTNSYLLCITKTIRVDESGLFFVNVKQNNFKFNGEDTRCKQMQSMKTISVLKNVSAVTVHPCDEWIVTTGGNDGEELELISMRNNTVEDL